MEREHQFWQCEHSFWNIGKSVHVQSDSLFTFRQNWCSLSIRMSVHFGAEYAIQKIILCVVLGASYKGTRPDGAGLITLKWNEQIKQMTAKSEGNEVPIFITKIIKNDSGLIDEV